MPVPRGRPALRVLPAGDLAADPVPDHPAPVRAGGQGAEEDLQRQAQRVRQLRAGLGLSQEQLARRLGVSFATVNRWERGRTSISAAALRRLEQLEDGPARPDRPRGQVGAHRSLPVFMTGFVGRTAALREVTQTLERHRLVTLVGLGGAGKSRLAVRVAALASGVQVAYVATPQPDAVLASVDQARSGGSGPVLLVLDGAAPGDPELAAVVSSLLAEDPRLRVLVTSRRPLGAPGEYSWPVGPLPLTPSGDHRPGAAAAVGGEAGELFLDRAAQAAPGFVLARGAGATVVELCRRLGGFPLALECAAAWVGALPVAEILARWDELLLPGREGEDAGVQAPLRAALWDSWQLLGPPARRVLEQLLVFRGSFRLTEVCQVCEGSDGELIAGLRELTEACWVEVEQVGEEYFYRVPPPARPFLLRCTAPAVDEGLRARHAAHAGELAAASRDGLTGADRSAWVELMTRAGPDMDAALQWAREHLEVEFGLRMGVGLWWWWLTTGRLQEGRDWLAPFLAERGRLPAALVAPAFAAVAALANEAGDYRAAVEHAGEALALFEELHDLDGSAKVATVLGSAQRYMGARAAARQYFELALEHRRALADNPGIASALNNLALVSLDDGALGEARSLLEEALMIKRRLGDPRTVAIGLTNLADVLVKQRSLEQAAARLDEAAQLAADLSDRQLLATIACNRGDLARMQSDLACAVGYYRLALADYRSSGGPHDVITVLCQLAQVLDELGRRPEAVTQLREAELLAVELASEERLAQVRLALVTLDEPVLSGWPDELTERQVEILRQIARGASNKAAAKALNISVATVERHLANIYDKLAVSGRVEATRYALAHGLVRPADAAR